jgi:hypothetical protein
VILIGAGLHGHVENGAADLAKLSGEIAGLNGYFLYRFDAGLSPCR